jgi:hypothetical protein
MWFVLGRIQRVSSLLRPRTVLRALARVDQLHDSTRSLEAQVEALRVKTEQLETAARLDWDLQDELAGLATHLDTDRIAAHVSRAVDRAPLVEDPFPHVLVEDWLPGDVYQTMMRGLPPAVFFADRDLARQRILVPLVQGPIYSRRVWSYIADEVVGRILREALTRKFEGVVRRYVESFCGPDLAGVDLTMNASDGRIMLRRPGYVITPHRDPKWGFVTGLVYLARKGDNESYGTQLYRVKDDEEAPNDKPFYVDESRCELVRSVPFKANTMMAFLNSAGAHGASIPADAQPADMERYLYQFRLGPGPKAIKSLLTTMEPERRERWVGAKAQRAY